MSAMCKDLHDFTLVITSQHVISGSVGNTLLSKWVRHQCSIKNVMSSPEGTSWQLPVHSILCLQVRMYFEEKLCM